MAVKMLLTFALIGIVLVGSGSYIGYRENQTAGLGRITAVSQIQGLAATQCSFQPGAYGSGSDGDMYIDDNMLRVDVTDLEINGYSGNMQAVLGTDNTLLISPLSIPGGSDYQNAEAALNSVITQAPWQCSPWWFPNDSLFDIQNGVAP